MRGFSPRSVLALIAVLGIVAALASRAPSAHTEQPLATARAVAPLEWIEILTGDASADEPLPLIVAIHGLGDRPEDFASLFSDLRLKARVLIPRAPISYSGGYGWTLIRAARGDRSALADELMERARSLEALLEARKRASATLGEPIAFGFSQGAMLTYILAINPSPKIGAAIPIAGLLVDETRLPERAPERAPIIHAFHGDADPLIPFSLGEAAVERLKERGYQISLHRGEGVPHRLPGAYRAAIFHALEEEIERAMKETPRSAKEQKRGHKPTRGRRFEAD